MKNITREQALMLAKRIVTQWENIDRRAEQFVTEFGLSQEVTKQLADHMRAAIGGEEVYQASLQLIQEEA